MNLANPDVWLEVPAWMPSGFDAGLRVEGPLMATCGYREGDILLVRCLDGAQPPEGARIVIETGGALACRVFSSAEALEPGACVIGVVLKRLVGA